MAKKNKRATQSAPLGTIPAVRAEFTPDYTNTKKDLTRIGILAGTFFAALIVLSFFFDAAVAIEDDDPVKFPNGAQAVRDRNGRFAGQDRLHVLLNPDLGLIVECTGGFVKYQDLRVTIESARYSYPLSLAAGKPHTPLAY